MSHPSPSWLFFFEKNECSARGVWVLEAYLLTPRSDEPQPGARCWEWRGASGARTRGLSSCPPWWPRPGPPRPRGVVTSPALDSVDRHLDRPPSGVFGWPLRCTPTHAHKKFILVASNKNTIVLQVICYFKIIVTSASPKRLHRMKLKWFYSILFTQTYFKI